MLKQAGLIDPRLQRAGVIRTQPTLDIKVVATSRPKLGLWRRPIRDLVKTTDTWRDRLQLASLPSLYRILRLVNQVPP